jgi:hypothetical protein
MAGPSRASKLYHKIVSDPTISAKLLEEMVNKQEPETDYMEFKGAAKANDDSIKRNWSKGLSCFANTEGGVLVWGIKADRISPASGSGRRIECANGLSLAPRPAELVQLLRDVHLQATVAPVGCVEITAVDAGGNDGSGFVVCLVPPSSHRPHRAALVPEQPYYMRIGDNTVVMPHDVLRFMFYPQLRSQLETEIQVFTKQPVRQFVTFEGKLYNRGGASAINLATRITVDQVVSAVHSQGFWSATFNGAKPPGYLFKAMTSVTLHPGDDCQFFQTQWDTPANRIEFRIILYALNQEPHEMQVVFEKDELQHLAVKKSTPVVS